MQFFDYKSISVFFCHLL